ncbi:Protein of uncharacterised function (DUF1602) [Mycobacterium tuberculosis]|nr:Protein of uncharacterised function (DUF1602) [Mycobacterium tuberculosis]
MQNTRGRRTIARPIATRCRCPPESLAGLRSSRSVSSSMSATSSTRRRVSARDIPAFRSANPMLAATVMFGYSA